MDLVTGIMSVVSSLVSRIWPDKTEEEKEKFTLELQKLLLDNQIIQNQTAIDLEEAKQETVFVSGWRPAVGWVCTLSFAWQFLLQPLISYLIVTTGHTVGTLPVFDYNSLNTILMGMLGLGAMRTYEKVTKMNNK